VNGGNIVVTPVTALIPAVGRVVTFFSGGIFRRLSSAAAEVS